MILFIDVLVKLVGSNSIAYVSVIVVFIFLNLIGLAFRVQISGML